MAAGEEIYLANITGGKDETTGIKNYTLSYWVPDYADFETVGESYFQGVPLVSRQFGNWESDTIAAGFQADLNYQGKSEDDPYQETWSFESRLTQDVIEQHPQLDEFLEKYEGELIDGKVTFPDYIGAELKTVKGYGTLSFGLSTSQKNLTPHPFAGARYIHYRTIVATRTYYKSSLGSLWDDEGKIFDRLPGSAPAIRFKHGQNWIKRAPLPETSGDGFLIRETYESSFPGGWKEGLHNLIIS